MDEPMGRCEGIVVSARQNISANRGRLSRHFGAPQARPQAYSGRMHTLPQWSLPRRLDRCARVVLLGIFLIVEAVIANAAEAGNGIDATLDQQVRRLALDAVRPGTVGVKRIEVSVGALDPRLRLAPCQRVEPYLPNGVRLWGKTRIGLRCTAGPSAWNVYLPLTVKAYGRALVAAAALPAGAVLAAGDLTQAEVDLADDTSMAISESSAAVGRTLVHALLPGQSLRLAHLKLRQWFAAGETVTVLAQGAGFSVASVGQALTAGIEGQSARVRTEGGRVLIGMPVADNRMELPL